MGYTKVKHRGTKKSLKENFENFFESQSVEAYQCYLDYYQNESYRFVKPALSAQDFLKMCQCARIDLCTISNKEKSLLLKEVEHCFEDIQFKPILSNGDTSRNKPAPEPVFKALSDVKYQINRENIWLAGDTKQDTGCAYNADILPVLIGSSKFMEEDYIKDKLASNSPLFIFQDFKELTVTVKK